MALSNVVKHYRDGSITLKDGTGTPLTLTVRFNMGDLTVSGIKAKLRDTVAYQARGAVTSIRHTDRVFPTMSFTFQVADFSETGTGTVFDFLLAKAATPFASRVSTLGSSAEVFCCDVSISEEGTNHGDSADGAFIAEDVELSIDFAEGQPNTATVNGTIYGAFTGDLTISATA